MILDAVKYNVIESLEDRASTIEFWDNNIIFIKLKDNIVPLNKFAKIVKNVKNPNREFIS